MSLLSKQYYHSPTRLYRDPNLEVNYSILHVVIATNGSLAGKSHTPNTPTPSHQKGTDVLKSLVKCLEDQRYHTPLHYNHYN